MALVRVRNQITEAEYTVAKVRKNEKEIDKPATDRNGVARPAKNNPLKATKATPKAEEA